MKSIIKNENITLTLDGRVLENGHIGSKIKLKLNDKVFIGKLKMKKQYLFLIINIFISLNCFGDSLWEKSQTDSMFNNETVI